MKPVLVFLGLFGTGLAILLFVQGPTRDDPKPFAKPTEQVEFGADVSVIDPPEKKGTDEEAGDEAEESLKVWIVPGGEFSVLGFSDSEDGQGPRAYILEAEDSSPLPPNGVELARIEAVLYDRETGEENVRLRAVRGQGQIKQRGGGTLGAITVEQIELEDVELEILSGAPGVPLLMRMETLSGDLQRRVFSTPGRASVEGDGLNADGTGFHFDPRLGLIRFDSDATARMAPREDQEGSLSSAGVLAIEWEGGKNPQDLKLIARDNARLSIQGESTTRLEAERIDIQGRFIEREDLRTVRFQTVDAVGSTILTMDVGQFQGDRARLDFTSDGEGKSGVLEGSPRGRIALRREGEELPDSVDPEELVVNFQGRGPLEFESIGRQEFVLQGPAELSSKHTRLTAEGYLRGFFDPDGEVARFRAREGVILTRDPEGVLSTDEFELAFDMQGGERRIQCVAYGQSGLTGWIRSEEETNSFVLRTAERLEFSATEDRWSVPLAVGVELELLGTNGFQARADRVRDFASRPFAFEAEGEVHLEGDRGSGSAHTLTAMGTDHVVLEGVEGAPAVFETEEFQARARRVERRGDLFFAEHVEEAALWTSSVRFDLSCDFLTASRERIPETGPDRVERFELSANGSVVARAELAEQSFDLTTDALHANGSGTRREREVIESTVHLQAEGQVETDLRLRESRYRISSAILEADHVQNGPDREPQGGAVARGDVSVKRLDGQELEGVGDVLVLDMANHGRLEAYEQARVRVSGRIPGQGHPFSMGADWLDFAADRFRAGRPTVAVTLIPSDADGGGAFDRLTQVVAAGAELDVSPEKFALTGDVLVQGLAGGEELWSVSADEVHLEGMAQADLSEGRIDKLEAVGDVAIVLAQGARATGDELVMRATRPRPRISGSPARLYYSQSLLTSAWIEYDMFLHGVSTAPGTTVEPLPPGIDAR